MGIKWVKILSALLICTSSTFASASLITDISTETIREHISTAGFGWQSSYDIGFYNQDLVIDVDIFLAGDTPSASLVNTWETGIESIWNDSFDIFDGTYLYDIVFNVDWVTTTPEADHTVFVHNGDGAVNLVDWYTGNPSGWGYSNQGRVAAHEFGHMIGLNDEYFGGATDPGLVRDDSIMGARLTTPQIDHFDDFVNWLSVRSGIDGLVAQASVGDNHYTTSVPVPVPASILLFATALLLINRRIR